MALQLDTLERLIAARKTADPESSYVAQLHHRGLNKILEKVGEECTEMIIAAKDYAQSESNEQRGELVGEAADLWFHTLVLLSHLDISQCDIMNELERRMGRSGLEEKASRSSD